MILRCVEYRGVQLGAGPHEPGYVQIQLAWAASEPQVMTVAVPALIALRFAAQVFDEAEHALREPRRELVADLGRLPRVMEIYGGDWWSAFRRVVKWYKRRREGL